MDAIDANLARIREGLRRHEDAQRAQFAPSESMAPVAVQTGPRTAVLKTPEQTVPSDPPQTFPETFEGDSAPQLQTAGVSDSAGSSPIVTSAPVHAEAPSSPSPSTLQYDPPPTPSRVAAEPANTPVVEREPHGPTKEGSPDDVTVFSRDLVVIKPSIWSRIKGFMGLR